MTITSRREFIIRIGSASAALASGPLLSACGGGSDESDTLPVRFDYGVASGDPLADRVILWTHAKHGDFDAPSQAILLDWEVAEDAAFSQVVARGQVTAEPAAGHTAKVDATGLRAGTDYYYRFVAGTSISPVGRTRTLPAADVENVKLAVFSCANYPAGYFHVYTEAVRQGAQYAIHLGDYIYEYAADGYASGDAQALGRVVQPTHEILTLDDYRRRYAQYRSDPDLKQLHASMPMIAVWDDHEISNNTWREGAENHTEGAESRFVDRLAAALQAYHEWLPIRTAASGDHKEIWRSFDFGNLLSLHMLDTRIAAREKQISLAELASPQTATQALARLASPQRTLLGHVQQQWLAQQLAASQARWQVLGQQVLMARMQVPVSILRHLNPESLDPAALPAAMQAIEAYLRARAIAAQAPQMLTDEQRALLDPTTNPKLGYNLDAWDGYPAAREAVLQTAHQLGKPLLVLAGDTHNAWHSDLTLMDGTKVGEEFATSSVSSPGFEEYLHMFAPAQLQALFVDLIDDLQYLNAHQRGLLLMDFTHRTATGHWIFVDTVKSRSYAAVRGHSAAFIEPAP
ncbi:alkaline phosphatase D family protein [Lampropedia cohaerens]|nr:alkaline phosphatase D family protein [Lampropedia cohaerens]